MSSINGLLVPNNFDIFAKSITTTDAGGIVTADSITSFTNKTTTDPSNTTAADILFSGGKTNLIDIGASPNPSAGQVLTATGANIATWQTPATDTVTPNNVVSLTNKTMTSSTNSLIAESVWSGSKTNVVDLSAAANPTAGQVLTASNANSATWTTPASQSVTPTNAIAFTNKTMTSTTNNVTSKSLHSATTVVDVATAAAPTAGQVLTASSGTAAIWATPAADSVTPTNAITLSNKGMLSPTNDLAAESLWSGGKSNYVNVGSAINPTVGQVLTATSATAATWQNAGAASVTPSNVVSFTNKTMTDPSNNVAASFLFSDSGGSAVQVAAAAGPDIGQVLTATSGVAATWQAIPAIPAPGTLDYRVQGTTIQSGTTQLIGTFVVPDQTNGAFFVEINFCGKGTPNQPLGYKLYQTWHSNNGVGTGYGLIVDNYSGTGISNEPTMVYNTENTYRLYASDGGLGTITWNCAVKITPVNP
jgi:hypothetical protein